MSLAILNTAYKWNHVIFVLLCLAYFTYSIMSSRPIHVVAYGRISFLFQGRIIFHFIYSHTHIPLYICISHFLYPCIHQWTFTLLLHFGYHDYKQGCSNLEPDLHCFLEFTHSFPAWYILSHHCLPSELLPML